MGQIVMNIVCSEQVIRIRAERLAIGVVNRGFERAGGDQLGQIRHGLGQAELLTDRSGD